MGRRIRWTGIALLACFAVLLVQLTNLQFRKASALANSPNNPKVKAERFDNERGDILAADGTVLATSERLWSNATDTYEYQRIYPQGSLFSEVVGFDSYNYGRVGVEATYNRFLEPRQQAPQSLGQLLSPVTSTDRVTLTLDPQLQLVAERALAGRDGAVVALDPSTGAIEALYSNPSYDPTPLVSPSSQAEEYAWNIDTGDADAEGFVPLSNMAVDRTFAPGSTFKVITSSAAYDHNSALVSSQFPQRGCIPLPGTEDGQLCNENPPQACGGDLAEMLPPSCDTGFATIGMFVGGESMTDEAEAFGYNSTPPVDFTTTLGVQAAHFPAAGEFASDSLGLAGLAQSSIGQGDVRATALQGALEAAAIANHGTIMTPHVMFDVTNAQGKVVDSYQPSVWKQATSPDTAAALTPLMEAVTQPAPPGVPPNDGGTAQHVGFRPQDQVAAKTGTAQSGTNNQYNTDWMVAFAPATSPKIAVAVVLPEQQSGTSGAECSGPVVNDMIQAALGVPASQLPSSTAGCPQVAP